MPCHFNLVADLEISFESERAVVEINGKRARVSRPLISLPLTSAVGANLCEDAMQSESQSVSGGKLEKFAEPIVSRASARRQPSQQQRSGRGGDGSGASAMKAGKEEGRWVGRSVSEKIIYMLRPFLQSAIPKWQCDGPRNHAACSVGLPLWSSESAPSFSN